MFKDNISGNKKSVASQVSSSRGGNQSIVNESAGYAIYHRTSEHFKK